MILTLPFLQVEGRWPFKVEIDDTIPDGLINWFPHGVVHSLSVWSPRDWTMGKAEDWKLKMNVDTFNRLWQDCQKYLNGLPKP